SFLFFFSSRRRHTRLQGDWSSDVCSSDLELLQLLFAEPQKHRYVRELMNMSGLALHTIQDELQKLTAVGLIVTWSNGYHRFYRRSEERRVGKECRTLWKP